MRRIIPLAAITLTVLSMMICIPISDIDAESTDSTWYCYGTTVLLDYPYSTEGVNVEWIITPYVGDEMQTPTTMYGAHVEKAIESIWTKILVKQTATSSSGDSASSTSTIIPIHSESPIKVRFWSAGELVEETVFDNTTSVKLGDLFVVVPKAPARNGFTFIGWFYDTACTQALDPKAPVLENVDVFAYWKPIFDGIGGLKENVGDHIVVFQSVNGLEYHIMDRGTDWISFTVSESEDHVFDMKDVIVMADSLKLTPVNGVYTILNIDRDVFVSIYGIELFTVEYTLKNVIATNDDGVIYIITASGGPFKVDLVPESGYTDLEVKVFMGGRDITPYCVDGGSVNISKVTANIVIVSSADAVDDNNLSIVTIGMIILVALVVCGITMFLIRRRGA